MFRILDICKASLVKYYKLGKENVFDLCDGRFLRVLINFLKKLSILEGQGKILESQGKTWKSQGVLKSSGSRHHEIVFPN